MDRQNKANSYVPLQLNHRAKNERPQRARGPRKRYDGIHWRAPTIMVAGLLAGIAFALGHHFFYRRFEGQAVKSESQQRWITRGGTSFAFLVKMCLAVATSTAYIQQVWKRLGERAVRVERVDAMFVALKDLTSFVDLKLWLGNPVLLVLALITWTLPIAAIITPGTIVVRPSLSNSTASIEPPAQLGFSKQSYGTIDTGPGLYLGPSPNLTYLSVKAAANQAILPIQPPSLNSSYELTFVAPGLECSVPNEAAVTAFNNTLAHSYFQYGSNPDQFNEVQSISYSCWAPSPSENFTLTSPDFSSQNSSSFDSSSADGEHLFFFVPTTLPGNVVLLDCILRNSTYTVTFNFEDNDQDIQVKSVHHGVGVPAGETLNDPNNVSPTQLCFTAVMEAFGSIVAGTVANTRDDDSALVYGSMTLIQITKLQQYIGSEWQPVIAKDFLNDVEGLFQNITLSLLSSSSFWISNEKDKQTVPVTSWLSTNIYVYRPLDVYLAYGISILCTLICVIFGCLALLHNGLSYTANFSTILRTTRRVDVTNLVTPQDTLGGAPLPDGIGTAVVQYDSNGKEERDAVRGFRVIWDDVDLKSVKRESTGKSSAAEVPEEENPAGGYGEVERAGDGSQRFLDEEDPPPRAIREYLGSEADAWSQEPVGSSSRSD